MDYNEIMKSYNLFYTKITEQSMTDGSEGYPEVPCELDIVPDYLCLYGNPKDYNFTEKTCVCFYQYDDKFDGIDGLFNAIYYNDEKLLSFYKDRFKNVRMVIESDYSQVRDIEPIENKYRQFRARIVGLWFLVEMKIPVIPNVNYADEYSFSYMLDGIRNAKTLAISLKGIMDKPYEEELLKKVIKHIVDNTKVEKFIIYSSGTIDSKVDEYFEYARKMNVKYYIPDNSLRTRNKQLRIDNNI